MKAQYLPLLEAADKSITDVNARARVLAVAIASAVSLTALLPSTAVESPSSFYITSVAERTRSMLSEFNENMVFDLQYALEAAQVLWMVRYGAAHPRPVALVDCACSLFEIQSGAAHYVSPELRAFTEAHKQTITRLIPFVWAIIDSVQQNQ